ncbi:MAG: hypothetical protein JWN37_334 [Candidatus Nomurabacteria bacterium]|nr:hypothetical protein [Candidatus Nomurabacteria bacterium]
MKKPVAQEHMAGCGIACAAFIEGVGYGDMLKRFKKGEENASFRGFYAYHIMQILTDPKSYMHCKVVAKNKEEIHEDGTFVYIAKNKEFPIGHWLVRHNEVWMNPWINYPSIKNVKAGFQNELPGKPVYAIFKKK